MIMLVTHRAELRDQLQAMLEAKGHKTCVPAHRQDVLGVMEECHPHLIVLDLYLADPSGMNVLRALRDDGYHGSVIVLSGPSMTTVLHDALSLGVGKVVHVPEQVDGAFLLGELELAIETSFREHKPDERSYHGQIAKRAHELYERDGRQHGRDMDHWLRAEQELASR